MIEVLGYKLFADEFDGFPRRVQGAILRALKRGGTAADTLITRAVAQDAGLRVGDVKKALRRRQATYSNPEFMVAAGFRRIPLINFSARGPKPSRGRGRGVSYRMGTGNPRTRIENAFIARVTRAGQDGAHSGHDGVFVRVGRGRLPIKQRYGPSLGKVFAKYRAQALERGYEVMRTTLEHELDRMIAADASKAAGAGLSVTEVGGD